MTANKTEPVAEVSNVVSLPSNAEQRKTSRPNNGWKKGQSGNPKGRQKETMDTRAFREMCRQFAPKAMEEIQKLAMHADKDSVRLSALQYLVEHGHGKPVQQQEVTQVTLTAADVAGLEPEEAYKRMTGT